MHMTPNTKVIINTSIGMEVLSKDKGQIPSTSDIDIKTRTVHSFYWKRLQNYTQVWEDDLLRTRLQEMLFLIRDVIMTKQGYLQLFFVMTGHRFLLKIHLKAVSFNTGISIISFWSWYWNSLSHAGSIVYAGNKNDTLTMRIAKMQ